mgnify:CR=1 FL=1
MFHPMILRTTTGPRITDIQVYGLTCESSICLKQAGFRIAAITTESEGMQFAGMVRIRNACAICIFSGKTIV